MCSERNRIFYTLTNCQLNGFKLVFSSYSHKGTKSALSDNCALRETKGLLYFIKSLKYRQYLDVDPKYLCLFKSMQFYVYMHAYGTKIIIYLYYYRYRYKYTHVCCRCLHIYSVIPRVILDKLFTVLKTSSHCHWAGVRSVNNSCSVHLTKIL